MPTSSQPSQESTLSTPHSGQVSPENQQARPVDQTPELAGEQAYVDSLFNHLDQEVEAANSRLAAVMLDVDPQNPDSDALVRRETEYHGLQKKLDRLNLAQLGLVFGRIDIDAPGDNPTDSGLDRRYIGRMGLDDRQDDYRTLLLDWRAPMARPFYLATTAQPEGVATRRHIRTRGRKVTAISDESLALGTKSSEHGVASESALREALDQARTGHMASIVETIQREQDEIIRDSTRRVMVVQGGPGTGKTAVALHRVAYLLYNHRDYLASTGVLILGPNNTFLEYISRVLPELGETGVVLSTVGDLFPGVHPELTESLVVREIKGSAEMVEILKNAVKSYQTIPETNQEIKVESLSLQITPKMVSSARTRARRSRKPHNDAQEIFREHLVGLLANQMAQVIGADPLGNGNLLSQADVDQLHDDLLEAPLVSTAVDSFWPVLTPTQVLEEFLSSKQAISAAAHDYDDVTQQALYRSNGKAWSTSDTALLDELAVLIGMPDPETQRANEDKEWRQQLADAEEALDILSSSESTDNDDDMFDAEILSAHDVIDAETLARRQEVRDNRSTAERAQSDHTWAYGHVIIDEAQELSPMEWRMVFRRSPSRWMTLVGDTAQTGSPAGVDSWAETLEPFVGNRFRHHTLTVNYRTPRPITELANQIVSHIDPQAQPAHSIRDGVPVAFSKEVPKQRGTFTDAQGRLVAIIDKDNVEGVKGLEYDHVTVVNPQAIVEASPQGLQDLYVAVTRATQTLTIAGEISFLELA